METYKIEVKTRLCSDCKKDKLLTSFPRDRTMTLGRSYRCKICYSDYRHRKRTMLRHWVNAYKMRKGCENGDCGPKDHAVSLDFDHLDPSTKKYEICRMVASMLSLESIKKEIAKCQVLCSNCHRVKTHKELHETR